LYEKMTLDNLKHMVYGIIKNYSSFDYINNDIRTDIHGELVGKITDDVWLDNPVPFLLGISYNQPPLSSKDFEYGHSVYLSFEIKRYNLLGDDSKIIITKDFYWEDYCNDVKTQDEFHQKIVNIFFDIIEEFFINLYRIMNIINKFILYDEESIGYLNNIKRHISNTRYYPRNDDVLRICLEMMKHIKLIGDTQ